VPAEQALPTRKDFLLAMSGAALLALAVEEQFYFC
jgi:hypothetical protein